MLKKFLNKRIRSTSIISDLFLIILILFLCYTLTLIPFSDYATIVPEPFPATIVVFLNTLLETVIFLVSILLIRKVKPALFVTVYFNLVYSILNTLVRAYRGRQICFHDVYSIKTLFTVSSDYVSDCPYNSIPYLIAEIIFTIFLTIFIMKMDLFAKECYFCITALILVLFGNIFLFTSKFLPLYPWENCGACYNGPLVELYLEFANRNVDVPEDYSDEKAMSLLSDVNVDSSEFDVNRPENIIVIMNEAFCDPEISMPESVKEVKNSDITPFIEQLKKESVHGYAYSSVYGGNTATSEWEFLTGESQYFLPMYSISYNQYLDSDQDSLVTLLKNNGYYAEAMHQNYSYGYNRKTAYGHLGFDETFFEDKFEEEEILRGYKTDAELYGKISDEIKNKDDLFVFAVSIQNHAPYTHGFENEDITVKDYVEDAEWNEYLNLIHISDNALENFITGLRSTNEKTMVVFFGDHSPGVENSLDSDTELYKIPYFIWKNYDKAEKVVEDDTSINYLSLQVLDEAGIKKDNYFSFLEEIKSHINVITGQFLMTDTDEYIKDDADIPDDIKDLIEDYSIVQYYRGFKASG